MPQQPAPLRSPDTATGPASRVLRLLVALAALWVFLSALAVMRVGAGMLAPSLAASTFTDSGASILGFGWLGAMLVLSGSPIAVSSLTLLDAHTLSSAGSLLMLTGSRLGASLVVLLVALSYQLRRSGAPVQRKAALSVGVLALVLTWVQYVPGAALGMALLQSGSLAWAGVPHAASVYDVLDAVTGPAANLARGLPNGFAAFGLGLALLLSSLRLLDRALPDMTAAALHDEDTLPEHRWRMFIAGSVVALITMSVSVAVTILIPAVARGLVHRRQALPWIAGANITTLGDTLLTAFLLGNSDAVRVVLAELIGVGIVTIILMAVMWSPLTQRLLLMADWLIARPARVCAFCTALAVVPVLLILI